MKSNTVFSGHNHVLRSWSFQCFRIYFLSIDNLETLSQIYILYLLSLYLMKLYINIFIWHSSICSTPMVYHSTVHPKYSIRVPLVVHMNNIELIVNYSNQGKRWCNPLLKSTVSTCSCSESLSNSFLWKNKSLIFS